MTEHDDRQRRWHEPRLPLAVDTQCLTLQLNVTLHPRTDSVKWVATLRDPIGGDEWSRWSGPLQEWLRGSDELRTDIDLMLLALGDFWRAGRSPTNGGASHPA